MMIRFDGPGGPGAESPRQLPDGHQSVLRTPLMVALEAAFGEERALAVVDTPSLEIGVFAEGEDAESGVVVAERRSERWHEMQRHDWFWDAMRGVATEVDHRWVAIPISLADQVKPVVIIPERRVYSALVRLHDGVRMVSEAAEGSEGLRFGDEEWPSFVAAVDQLAFEGEFYG